MSTVPYFIHFTLAETGKLGDPDRWVLTPDSYSVQKGPPVLEPTRHMTPVDACEAALRLASQYRAGWTIRRADMPGSSTGPDFD